MRGLTASVVAAAVLASPAPGQVAAGGAGDAPFRQVITSDDLREYGARQLTDVLGLIDDWHHGSVDGFTWRSAPRGLGTYGEPQWLVMVDGHMVDVDLFGVRSLNRIPIALSQVDSIEVISVPAYVSGTFAGGGVLRLHTRTPPSGFSVRALGFTANETGDPGPYRFTELRTPNVDRIGSGATGALSHGGGKLTLDLAGGWQGHLVTDPPVRGRNFDITTGHYPMITQGGVSLSVGLHARGGDHRLLLAHSRSRDYFLLQPFGREVPVHSPYTHAGITGALRLGGPARIDYRVSFERNQLDKHDNTLGLDFDWELDRWRAAVTLSSRLADQPLSLSVGVERTDAGTGYELTDDDFYIGSVTGRLGYRLDARQVGSLALEVATAGHRSAVNAAVNHRIALGPVQALEAVVSYLQRLPEEDTRVWLWRSRGYAFLSDNGVEVTGTAEPGRTRTLGLDLRWRRTLERDLSAFVGGYARHMSGLLMEQQEFFYDPLTETFGGPVRLVAHREGAVLGGEVGVEWSPAERIAARGYYVYQHAVGGHTLFEEEWSKVPSHRLTLQTTYNPWPTVTLRGGVRHQSSATWRDYAAIDDQTGGAYSSVVSGRILVEVAAQKWLWRRRLRLHLMLRDLFDEEQPLHPIGAAYGLSFLVQGELRLDGLALPSSSER